MKKILFLLLSYTIVNSSFAQFDIYSLMNRTDISIQEAQQIAQRHFDTVGTGRGTGYKQFQRWLYERKFHVDVNGNFIPPQVEWNNYVQSRTETTQGGNWVLIGPSGWNRTSSWNPGSGRLTHVA